eukprot:m.104181 g.104181  ORF g.104181 m.104181 type:complete len:68 (+) comp15068_c0_seq2:551-754(+)
MACLHHLLAACPILLLLPVLLCLAACPTCSRAHLLIACPESFLFVGVFCCDNPSPPRILHATCIHVP